MTVYSEARAAKFEGNLKDLVSKYIPLFTEFTLKKEKDIANFYTREMKEIEQTEYSKEAEKKQTKSFKEAVIAVSQFSSNLGILVLGTDLEYNQEIINKLEQKIGLKLTNASPEIKEFLENRYSILTMFLTI